MSYVLAVDDDESHRAILKKELTLLGYRVELFASAHKALDHCRMYVPAFILLDFHLDGVNGADFVRELRTWESHSKTPVIVCTGESNEQHVTEMRTLGVVGYLLKPFRQDDLLRQLKKLQLYPPKVKKR